MHQWFIAFHLLGFYISKAWDLFFHIGFIAWQWKRSTYKVLRLWKNKRWNQNRIVTYLEHTLYCTCSNTQIHAGINGLIFPSKCNRDRTPNPSLYNCYIHQHSTSVVKLWIGERKSHYNIKFFNLSKTNEKRLLSVRRRIQLSQVLTPGICKTKQKILFMRV